jgi:enamine deaminase RidA (YjgF/YER057c/UK114 family)
MPTISSTLQQLGISLPPVAKPVASYLPFVRTGNLVFVSGQLPSREGKLLFTGSVPQMVSPEDAKEAAKVAIVNAIAALNEACAGDLERVVRIVRIGVFVQSADDFHAQPAVANGASDLLVSIFGEKGRHARAAVGVNTLPLNATVEIELLAEISS